MSARTKDACTAKHSKLWGCVLIDDKFICAKCSKVGGKKKYMARPFSHFAVCLLDDHRTTSQYYVVSKRDLYDQHRAVEGASTANLNPVSTEFEDEHEIN